MKHSKLYPPRRYWQAMREERLQEVGYQCELCGLPDASEFFNERKPHPFYPQGTPYRQYLQLAHKQQYRKWDRDADCLIVCPPCHGRFDAEYQRKPAVHGSVPLGQVVVWVWYKGERCLAAEARRLDDLFGVVASFADGMQFELQVEALMKVVGTGRYRKESSGVLVVREKGACVSFGDFLEQVLLGVVV